MMEATRSPYMDLAVAVDWYFLEEKNLLEKQLPSHRKGAMEPCSSVSRTLLCGQDKPFEGRACPWFPQQGCYSTMLKYKGAQKEPASDNDYLGQVLPRKHFWLYSQVLSCQG